jgi:hypothetical protein
MPTGSASTAKTQFIDPARSRGETTVSIRPSDVHSALAVKNCLPLVCSALGAAVFERLAVGANRYRRPRQRIECCVQVPAGKRRRSMDRCGATPVDEDLKR